MRRAAGLPETMASFRSATHTPTGSASMMPTIGRSRSAKACVRLFLPGFGLGRAGHAHEGHGEKRHPRQQAQTQALFLRREIPTELLGNLAFDRVGDARQLAITVQMQQAVGGATFAASASSAPIAEKSNKAARKSRMACKALRPARQSSAASGA